MEEGISNRLIDIQHQWPLIARDIALMCHPQQGSTQYTAKDIAANYSLSIEDFRYLIRLPVFQDILKIELAKLKALGPDAGYKMRIEAFIMDIQEQLYVRIKRGTMDDKSAIQFLQMLMSSVGLITNGKEQPTASSPVNNTAVNISFNVPKLPNNRKLNHILAQPQTNVIDYTG